MEAETEVMHNAEVRGPETKPKPRSLVGKLAAILGEIDRVPKHGRNTFHGYNYVTESDIVDAIRGRLAAHGVFITTTVLEVTSEQRQGGMTVVVVKTLHTFHDADSDEKLAVEWFGVGDDKGDKGIYKAMTGDSKYFLMKQFLVSSGDDPEDERPQRREERRERRPEPQQKAPQPQQQPERVVQEAPRAAEAQPQPAEEEDTIQHQLRNIFLAEASGDQAAAKKMFRRNALSYFGDERPPASTPGELTDTEATAMVNAIRAGGLQIR